MSDDERDRRMAAEGYTAPTINPAEANRWATAVQEADCTADELREARLLFKAFGLDSGLAFLDKVKARKGKTDGKVG